jgi:ketosteroid isomerase-like protein
MVKILLLVVSFILLLSCVSKSEASNIEKWKNEILKTEKEFAELVKTNGLHEAFLHYAADSAVLLRNNKLIIGKNNIDLLYQGQNSKGLYWSPDFVDVSEAGDLGYTYGKYVFSYTNEAGDKLEDNGIFHSVWKRQSDGNWKFVWD